MTNIGGMLFSSGQRAPVWVQPSGAQEEASKAPRRLRIIVADDDRDQVLTLTELLGSEGHDVRGLYRGKELVQAVSDFEPDVLILDIKLPDASGFEVAEKIRERYRERRPLLIAISGVFKKGVDRILCEMVGFDHHLTKPFAFDALLELIKPLMLAGPYDKPHAGTAGDTAKLARRAAALLGREELATQLKVPGSQLEDWIEGRARMPERKLALLAEILARLAERK
jgi:DNA-binding response OmpR family regulator